MGQFGVHCIILQYPNGRQLINNELHHSQRNRAGVRKLSRNGTSFHIETLEPFIVEKVTQKHTAKVFFSVRDNQRFLRSTKYEFPLVVRKAGYFRLLILFDFCSFRISNSLGYISKHIEDFLLITASRLAEESL